MSKPKPSKDRHKPRRMVGVSERICVALDRIGLDQEANLTEMVKRACVFYLEHLGQWPPPPPKPRS